MAENKTKVTKVSPAALIKQMDERRRKDCQELVAMMSDITGHSPKMWGTSIVGFGQAHYKYANCLLCRQANPWQTEAHFG